MGVRTILFNAIGRQCRIPALRQAAILALALVACSLAVTFQAQAHRGTDACPGGYDAGSSPLGRDAALVIDGKSGQILFERNSTAERHPASLTKMMTLYLLFESLQTGQLTLQTQLMISRHAASQFPVNLGLAPGMTMSVESAIKAIIVRSANDVAVAVAEAVGGTESHFAEMMTAKARALGMRDTFYHNASGLPDALQISTASDLAILARRLAYDFPQYFPYFATLSFRYHHTTYYTHDNLLGRFKGTDGIKTGYTNASGFNLVSSVVRDGAHVIGVVMGGDTARQRDNEMVRLLTTTFKRVQADPTLVAHGLIPWKTSPETVAISGTLPPAPAYILASPPQPVISLSAPSFDPLLSRSGEINEDIAESFAGSDEVAALLGHTNCPQRKSDRRV